MGFNFFLQEEVQKEIIRHAETNLFFKGIDRGELGIVDVLIKVFKFRSKNMVATKISTNN